MSDDRYHQLLTKFHRDLADGFAAAARGDWDEARRAFENRVAPDCAQLAVLVQADRS